LTLANIYGLRAGAVCTVYADRTTGEFQVTGEQRAAKTASRAVALLAEMDERVAESESSEWHARLGL
jgi:uridine phosphorylase